MEMFQTILLTITILVKLMINLVSLTTSIQTFLNNRKRELKKDKCDLYHKARMTKFRK